MKYVKPPMSRIKDDTGNLRPPSPMQQVHTESMLAGQDIYIQSIKSEKDLRLMLVSAIAWKNGMGNVWFEASKEYLLAWIKTYEPEYHPINETVFDQLIQTYAIIKSNLSPQERSDINKYLYNWANGYITRINNAPKGISWYSNWQSHRIKLITLIAVATDNDHLFNESRRLFQKQIEENMNSEGEVVDFKQRDAIHYVVYDLQPLLQAALAAMSRGEDWYHWIAPNNASLEKGVNWLTPYVTGEKTHNEFINSKIKLDAIRKQRGLKNFNGIFRPEEAKSVYWLASAFNASYEPLALKLLAKPPLIMDWCN
ncbi:alginate lyase family protein [Klebsiella quasipneumoniae]|uniref:alginate lyase family protein n=1 Tax=Klebsiella quasipneumoniae TaxID=1463165 RepID=UPI002113EDF5|nr:alginate lyase family protein [Klebsiella quasipneumoniae]MDD7844214.1 alginate lyase family protein [Klebsiella quasipneumoniae]MDD7858500.1 alginate lyase family protein [Klebsiella quasipneumoniae]MDF8306166.1 alginate lyase family protein [Klebsiella quasipneumoniae]MDG0510547.1 alginate lyase family protein [Klebsiella quasipneumoniae]MDG0520927.1 alginate lyase family protein [Klebsiella quasipneumoniae]